MACPTCDHTMEFVGPVGHMEQQSVYWCPRCGTLKVADGEREDVSTPKIVERCREFETHLYDCENNDDYGVYLARLPEDWRRFGIAESINPPDRRGKPLIDVLDDDGGEVPDFTEDQS
jgi:Zn-finger nucleic acid-binding protein